MQHSVVTSRFLHVEGRLWSGSKYKFSYPLVNLPEDFTKDDLRKVAGDFETITRYRVEERTVVTCTDSKRLCVGINLK